MHLNNAILHNNNNRVWCECDHELQIDMTFIISYWLDMEKNRLAIIISCLMAQFDILCIDNQHLIPNRVLLVKFKCAQSSTTHASISIDVIENHPEINFDIWYILHVDMLYILIYRMHIHMYLGYQFYFCAKRKWQTFMVLKSRRCHRLHLNSFNNRKKYQ